MKACGSASAPWLILALAAASAGSFRSAYAAVSYTTPGSTYSQTFDSLPIAPEATSLQTTIPWTDDSTSSSSQTSLPGWYLYHPTVQAEGGVNGHQRLRIASAPGNTGAFYSFGPSGNTDRALGDIGANTLAPDGQTGNDAGNLYVALRLSNNTGQTLDSFTLSNTGEQWRDGGTSTAETMTLGWSTTATAVSDASTLFNNVPTLSWTSPKATATAGALDGNNAANHVLVSAITVTGLNWADGTDLWLRWTDPQLSGKADQGMAIDDVVFSADVATIPEPTTASMFALGLLALHFLRRTRKH